MVDQFMNSFLFINLFAGIGGFHLALHQLGGECVYASEWDSYARKTYIGGAYLTTPTIKTVGFLIH